MKHMVTYTSGTKIEVYTTSGFTQVFESVAKANRILFKGNNKTLSALWGFIRSERKSPIIFNNLNYYARKV